MTPPSRDCDRDRRMRLYWNAADRRKRKRARRIRREICRANNAVLRAHFARIGNAVHQVGIAFQRATAAGSEFSRTMQRINAGYSKHRMPSAFDVANPDGSVTHCVMAGSSLLLRDRASKKVLPDQVAETKR